MIVASPHLVRMAPYALAEMSAPAGVSPVSLAQNESLRPPSPLAIEAAVAALGDAALYPDPDSTALRAALAARHGLTPENVLCATGSLDLIGCLARAFAGPGRAVLAPAHAYPFFRTAALAADARLDVAPELDAVVDVDALLAAVRPDTRLVFVANPGNPTGTRLPKPALERLRAGLPPAALLVIDEAYGEFCDALEGSCLDLCAAGDVVVLRTFSKAYGMAGLRVGWGAFPPRLAREVRKLMNPNNVSAPAQAAAIAALEDDAYMRRTCALTIALRERAAAALRQAGFHVRPSFTNFLLIDLLSADAAARADAFLRAEGVFLRRQAAAGLPNALRMTIAPEDALTRAVDRLIAWRQEPPT